MMAKANYTSVRAWRHKHMPLVTLRLRSTNNKGEKCRAEIIYLDPHTAEKVIAALTRVMA